MTPQRILFMTEGTSLAHVARPYALAMTLDPDRYEVHFAAPSKRYTDAVLADAPFRVWPLVRTEFRTRIQRLVDGLFWSEAELERGIEEDRELIRAIRPNLIVVDERPSITVSAGLEGAPTASIASVIWTDDVLPTWRQPAPEAPLPYIRGLTPAGAAIAIPFFRRLATRPINRVRRRHGLPSLGARFSALFEADHLLFLEPPSLFRLRASIPARHHFLGSPDWSSAGPLPPWWDDVDDDRPIVYVGTGTSGNRALLPKIVEAVAGLPSRVAVTTGGRDVALPAFDNVFAAPYLPGADIARRAALVITNGGSPGTYQSLAVGTPVLAIPSNIDQHRTMAAIAWRGATAVVRSDQASVRSLRNAVQRMLGDDAVRAAARSIATDFKRYPAADLFPRFVESVVRPLA